MMRHTNKRIRRLLDRLLTPRDARMSSSVASALDHRSSGALQRYIDPSDADLAEAGSLYHLLRLLLLLTLYCCLTYVVVTLVLGPTWPCRCRTVLQGRRNVGAHGAGARAGTGAGAGAGTGGGSTGGHSADELFWNAFEMQPAGHAV